MATSPSGFNPASTMGSFTEAIDHAVNAFKDVIELMKDFKKGIDELPNDYFDFVNTMGREWIDIQDKAMQTARSIGMSRDAANAYNRTLIENTVELSRAYGTSAEEIQRFQQGYTEATGRAVMMTKEQTEAMIQVGNLTSPENAAKMADEFDRFGMGIEQARDNVARMSLQAKALGLNQKQASELLVKNVHLAAEYQFRNGIDGLEKMVQKSMNLRINMESIVKASEKFNTIEGAIETSAQLQMLGGTFAQNFSNPMAVMNEALTDENAFMDRIVNMISGKGTFNEKTGMVEYSPLDQRFIAEAAKILGMDKKELTNMSERTIINERIEKEINPNANMSDTQKSFIMNQARWDDKNQKYVIDQRDKNGNIVEGASVGVDELTAEDVTALQDLNVSEETVMQDVRTIRDILEREYGSLSRDLVSTKENLEGMQEGWKALEAAFEGIYMPFFSEIMNGMNGLLGSLFTHLAKIVNMASAPAEWLGKTTRNFFDMFGFESGGIVSPSVNALPSSNSEPLRAEFGKFIQGNSHTGDRTLVRANAGEMILNTREQQNLWNIFNESSSIIDAQSRLTKNSSTRNDYTTQEFTPLQQKEISEIAKVMGMSNKELINMISSTRDGDSLSSTKENAGIGEIITDKFIHFIAGDNENREERSRGGVERSLKEQYAVAKSGTNRPVVVQDLYDIFGEPGNSLLDAFKVSPFGKIDDLLRMSPVVKTFETAKGVNDGMMETASSLFSTVNNSSIGDSVRNTINNVSSVMSAANPINVIGKLFSGNRDARAELDEMNANDTTADDLLSLTANRDAILGSNQDNVTDLQRMVGIAPAMSEVNNFFNPIDSFGVNPKVNSREITDVQRMVGTFPVPMPTKEIGEHEYVSPVRETSLKEQYESTKEFGPQTVSLSINGNIRLDGGNGNGADLDMNKLLENQEFVNAVTDMIVKRMSENANAGRNGKEYNEISKRTK